MELLLDEGTTVLVELEQALDFDNPGFRNPRQVILTIDGWYVLVIKGDGTIERLKHVDGRSTGMIVGEDGKVQMK